MKVQLILLTMTISEQTDRGRLEESGTEKGFQQQGCGSQLGAAGLQMPTDPFCNNVFTCIRQSAWDYKAN